MSALKVTAAAAFAAALSACTSLPTAGPLRPIFGSSAVAPQVADSLPDGSLSAGVGRTGFEDARDQTNAETVAEDRGMTRDIPYAVSR